MVHKHFERFLVGQDLRNTNLFFEQMFRASMSYGRKGLPIEVISVVDLALWDLLGKIRSEPVYKMIGGARDHPILLQRAETSRCQADGFLGW